jgi:hypothetical protein
MPPPSDPLGTDQELAASPARFLLVQLLGEIGIAVEESDHSPSHAGITSTLVHRMPAVDHRCVNTPDDAWLRYG